MKAIFWLLILGLVAPVVRAQTNLTELLQQGMFEEQANRNLDAAIADYEALSTQFDKDRQLAATAVFRLGECYREEGQTNQAAVEYRRIISEFPDQKTLAMLSQQDLAGMGAASSLAGEIIGNPAAPVASGNTSAEVALLANEISGIESLTDTVEQARAVLAISPENSGDLQRVLMHLPMLQDQEAWAEAHPQTSFDEYDRTRGFVFAIGGEEELPGSMLLSELQQHVKNTNLLDSARWELQKELTYIRQHVDFVLGLQKARLKALQAAAGTQAASETAQGQTPTDDEDQEIARIQQMIQNSPDLVNAPGSNGRTPLEDAAANGQLKVAAFLLDHGANVNIGGNGGRPLVAAARAAQRTMVQFLLEHGADINAGRGAALEAAIEHGYEAVAETLLKAHADVNVQNDLGQTPLNLAAQAGNTNLIQMLLAAGADPNIADNYHLSSLSGATRVNFPPDLSALRMLLAAKADPVGNEYDSPLLYAVINRNIKAAELLLQAGANPNLESQVQTVLRIGYNPTTPLWTALYMSELPMVKLLLKYKANPNDSQINNTPIIFSALDKPNILKALLDAGANPNVTNDNGRTPLSFAAEEDSPEAVTILLAAKADPNGGTLDTPLSCAIHEKDAVTAKLLLQAGADPNAGERSNWARVGRLLIFSALSDTNVLKALLDARANPNVLGMGGDTPLADAVFNEEAAAVAILLMHGANPNLGRPYPGANPSDTRPLFLAAYRLNEEILLLLLNNGADPNVRDRQGNTALRFLEDVVSGNRSINNIPSDQQKAIAASMADLLRQRGALEVLPDWDHITVSRPSVKYSEPAIYIGTNGWNQFTLMELFFKVYYPTVPPNLSFPDFTHITIVRPNTTGKTSKRIQINLLNSTNGVDCSQDAPLEFGDVVEVSEREHTLAESDTQTDKLISEMAWCLKKKAGTAKLIVDGGQSIQLPLANFEPVTCYLGDMLSYPTCRNVLLSDSDLSRVKVTRRDPKTGKSESCILDRSSKAFDPSDLWLRDGDVIEVPELR